MISWANKIFHITSSFDYFRSCGRIWQNEMSIDIGSLGWGRIWLAHKSSYFGQSIGWRLLRGKQRLCVWVSRRKRCWWRAIRKKRHRGLFLDICVHLPILESFAMNIIAWPRQEQHSHFTTASGKEREQPDDSTNPIRTFPTTLSAWITPSDLTYQLHTLACKGLKSAHTYHTYALLLFELNGNMHTAQVSSNTWSQGMPCFCRKCKRLLQAYISSKVRSHHRTRS